MAEDHDGSLTPTSGSWTSANEIVASVDSSSGPGGSSSSLTR